MGKDGMFDAEMTHERTDPSAEVTHERTDLFSTSPEMDSASRNHPVSESEPLKMNCGCSRQCKTVSTSPLPSLLSQGKRMVGNICSTMKCPHMGAEQKRKHILPL